MLPLVTMKQSGPLFLTLLITLGTVVLGHTQTKPIALHPQNPHYFLYKGKSQVLITSAEHYGAVLNLDFNYIKYLNELKAHGLNLTRTFTGTYVEPNGAFGIAENTLAPAAGRLIVPWKRSHEPGYTGGGDKFDLDAFDAAYFIRLRDFVHQAQKRGVIVELALFCPFYEDAQWNLSPMNSKNNVNGLGTVNRTDVYTMDKHQGLLSVQERLVRKIVTELKQFPNLIYELCNEPYFGGVTLDWQAHIAAVIQSAEKDFRYKHLISQNIANDTKKINDPNPAVSVFNFHYATPPTAVEQNYGLNKVIGDNETGFKGNADDTYRSQGWQFILAGGALFNNLDYSFASGKEDGTFQYPSSQPGGGSVALRKQLGYLLDFISSVDFILMKPDQHFYSQALRGRVWALSDPGKAYLLYLHQPKLTTMEVDLDMGTYQITWLDTKSGKNQRTWLKNHRGGKTVLNIPAYDIDIALSIKRIP